MREVRAGELTLIPRPGKPYVWVTWITGLLSGEEKCAWRYWVKARHQSYQKPPEDPEDKKKLQEWNKLHDAMVVSRAERLKQEGYEVRVEDANSFRLVGDIATLAGKPDVIGLKPKEKYAILVDEKSGRPKDRYIWQVMIYQFAKKLTDLKGWTIHGEVEYQQQVVPVSDALLTQDATRAISDVVKRIVVTEPPRVPSAAECKYCDVVACPDRYKEQTQTADVRKYF